MTDGKVLEIASEITEIFKKNELSTRDALFVLSMMTQSIRATNPSHMIQNELTDEHAKIIGNEIGKKIGERFSSYHLLGIIKSLGRMGSHDSIIHQLGEAIGRGMKNG